MVRIKRSVDIRTSPQRVFELVLDLARRLRLNPKVESAEVVRETSGPIGVGTVFRVRAKMDGRDVEYRARCTAFDPGRLFETTSLTDPPFGMRVTVESIAKGTRLTQEEWIEPRIVQDPLPRAKGLLGKLAAELAQGLTGRTAEDRRFQEQALKIDLGADLDAWLKATKKHLEGES